jgi:transcriptional regulator with XRE-family HTH domain
LIQVRADCPDGTLKAVCLWDGKFCDLLTYGGLRLVITLYGRRFGKRLSTLCDIAGVEPKELAGCLNITMVQMRNYINGRQFPTGVGIIRLHLLFGVSPGVILGTDPIDHPPDKEEVRKRIDTMLS